MGCSLRQRTDQNSRENFLQWLESEKDPPELEVKTVNDYAETPNIEEEEDEIEEVKPVWKETKRKMAGNQRKGKTWKAQYHRVAWTSQEKKALWEAFGQFIKSKTVPRKADIERVMSKSTEFDRRSWKNVKDAVRNIIAKSGEH